MSMSFLFEVSSSATNVPSSALIETSWTAVEITNVTLPGNNHPVTLSFHSDGIMSGSAACNEYHGNFEILSDKSFRSSGFSLTRMYCSAQGLMEQERDYISFLEGRTFPFEIRSTIGEDGFEKVELVLFDDTGTESPEGGESVEGLILARFAQGDGGGTQRNVELTRRRVKH